ncbi:MAG: RNA 2',3'-cyclic phosphodiesterase [Rhodospirillales bacterium]|nr:RNA 2',3'-cyclic phosphodiesterase [Rhodospirillales bacterium]
MMRLFVALSLPVDVRAQLGTTQAGLPGARWIDTQNMHLTLRFIGEMPEPDAHDLSLALSHIHAPAFDLSLSGIGYFDRRGTVHSVWARAQKSDALLHLQSKIESVVVRSGGPVEKRKFTPHVTLGRLKGTPVERIGPWLETSGVLSVPPFPVTEFALFQSKLGHGGARYIELAAYPLIEPPPMMHPPD